jgi:hypothetical protein
MLYCPSVSDDLFEGSRLPAMHDALDWRLCFSERDRAHRPGRWRLW